MAPRQPHPLSEAVAIHLEQNWLRSHGLRHGSGVLDVPIDLYDTGDAYVLRAAIPGAKAEEVQITVLGDTIRIQGHVEMHQADPAENVSWLVHEVPHGSFLRAITLPRRADPDKATARFEDGILTLRLPKAEQSGSRQITITPGTP